MKSTIKLSCLCFFALVVFLAAPAISLAQDLGVKSSLAIKNNKTQEPTEGQCLAVINKVLEMRDPDDSMGARDAALYKKNWEKMDAKTFAAESSNLAGRFCTTLNSTYKSVPPCSEDEQKKEPMCQFYNICKKKIASTHFNGCLETLNRAAVVTYDPFIRKRYLVLKRESEWTSPNFVDNT